MKILLATILFFTVQIAVVPAQENSKKIIDAKSETIVPVIRQAGSLRFLCTEKPGVFSYEYYLQIGVRENPDCVNPFDLLKIDSNKQTLIGYQVTGDCDVRARAKVFRDDAAKTLRVEIIKKSGKCRRAGNFQGWTVVERVPQDYKAEFTETNADETDDFKIELLEETFSLTESSRTLKSRTYEMDGCPQYYGRGEFVIRSEAELLKNSLDEASRKRCLDKSDKVDFKKEILIGTTIYSGYCGYPPGLKSQVMRDDRRKRYVVFITYDDPYGRTCRARGIYGVHLAVPKPPAGYEIDFVVASVLNKSFEY